MIYELAKQLKDAGFPQYRPQYISDAYSNDGKSKHMWQHWTVSPLEEFNDPEAIKIPTLSELIEACKGTIQSFRFFINFVSNEYGIQQEGQSLDDVTYYPTPEEAVAKLWLALNKK